MRYFQWTSTCSGKQDSTHEIFPVDKHVGEISACLNIEVLRADKGGAALYEWLACSPPSKANRVQFPAGPLLEFCKWGSCRTMPLVSGFSRRSLICPVFAFWSYSILTSLHPHRLSRPRCLEPCQTLHSLTRCIRVNRGKYGASPECKGGETGDPRGKPLTGGIVPHNLKCEYSGANPPWNRTRIMDVNAKDTVNSNSNDLVTISRRLCLVIPCTPNTKSGSRCPTFAGWTEQGFPPASLRAHDSAVSLCGPSQFPVNYVKGPETCTASHNPWRLDEAGFTSLLTAFQRYLVGLRSGDLMSQESRLQSVAYDLPADRCIVRRRGMVACNNVKSPHTSISPPLASTADVFFDSSVQAIFSCASSVQWQCSCGVREVAAPVPHGEEMVVDGMDARISLWSDIELRLCGWYMYLCHLYVILLGSCTWQPTVVSSEPRNSLYTLDTKVREYPNVCTTLEMEVPQQNGLLTSPGVMAEGLLGDGLQTDLRPTLNYHPYLTWDSNPESPAPQIGGAPTDHRGRCGKLIVRHLRPIRAKQAGCESARVSHNVVGVLYQPTGGVLVSGQSRSPQDHTRSVQIEDRAQRCHYSYEHNNTTSTCYRIFSWSRFVQRLWPMLVHHVENDLGSTSELGFYSEALIGRVPLCFAAEG
ncbi:hypothetical protein PR048_026861 [Dryococelus australis]|uniref:Uncharacterized protein n=1 Tax=Dryococelus australis TaxID=614101 RepID=A0ABQ9GMI2_9NEOP|nr:hypothetical protein PR048_026861 [Dryococelus australis]